MTLTPADLAEIDARVNAASAAETVYPHVPAAFINALREESSKQELAEYLQTEWNIACALRKQIRQDLPALSAALKEAWAEIERLKRPPITIFTGANGDD